MSNLEDAPLPLVELFLADTREHSATLKRGLSSLAEDASRQRALLPDLLLAAHSIRGAAKIIGFEAAARVAEAVEARLLDAEHSGARLHPQQAPKLASATESFERMVAVGAPELRAWAENQAGYLESVVAQLKAPSSDLPRPTASRVTPASKPTASAKSEANIVELFRAETAACTDVLSRGLVELEAGGRADLESLMRAAHSIKGAARIVGLELAVRIAHALEDCLVKAQEGILALPPKSVDLLLAAVDVLSEMGQVPMQRFAEWELERSSLTTDLLERLRHLSQLRLSVPHVPSASSMGLGARRSELLAGRLSGAPADVQIQVKPAEPMTSLAPMRSSVVAAPSAASSLNASVPARDRVVRVNAQSINRLMGLAGASLVESRRVQTFGSALQRLRRRQSELAALLEALDRQSGDTLDALGRATLEEAKTRAADCRSLLGAQMTELDSYARRVDDLSDRLYREALKSRMRPFGDCAHGFPRMVRDVARQLGKEVRFDLSGEATDVDRDVLESLEAPLTHLLRNAVDHGLETPAQRAETGKAEQGVVRIEARHHAGMLAITVTDDGRGIDPAALRRKIIERGLLAESVAQALSAAELLEFIFLPGFSTASSITEISGRGVGLDAVRSMVESASGFVRVSSELGRGTSFHLQLPVTRSVMRAVVAEVSGEAYAFPLLRIERILRVPAADVQTLAAVQYFLLEGESVSLVGASQLLGFGSEPPSGQEVCVVVIGDRARRYGLAVERFLGEHDLVVRPLDARLGKVQDIAAAAILVDGTPALILDVDDLMRSIEKLAQSGRIDKLTTRADSRSAKSRKRVLVVDDSITVREVERQLLVNRGYEVDVAVDGVDGLNSARGVRYDLIVTDIDMPRMNGLELVRAIKQDTRLSATPIIIVSYKDREQDRLRGLDAGANYYLTKSSFHDETLVRAVEDLIGSADA
ncbi:MAG: chemotaxis protein histidine kinaselike protein [Polyangiaceae bacterium]|nr:chemotaxis protein histidine kinaselike protein [Polyangiaceae bacterium]